MEAVNVDVSCPNCWMVFTPFPSLSPAIILQKEKTELIKEIGKLQEETARLREALEFYADPNSWVDESVTYVYSVIQYDDQDIPPEEHRLCDKHGGRRAREALKGKEE